MNSPFLFNGTGHHIRKQFGIEGGLLAPLCIIFVNPLQFDEENAGLKLVEPAVIPEALVSIAALRTMVPQFPHHFGNLVIVKDDHSSVTVGP
jgi:hypothetical protein